jgi:antitoxin Phd
VRTLRLREAKASFSAVVEAAEHGEPTTITKHGRPAAVVMPVKDAHRLYAGDRPSFAALLIGIPHAVETERDPSPLREADL